MNMWATPQEGIYIVKTPDFKGGFKIEQAKVKVLGENEKSMLIKLMCNVRGHRAGDQLKVRRHNVRMPNKVTSGLGSNDKPVREYDYSDKFWNQ